MSGDRLAEIEGRARGGATYFCDIDDVLALVEIAKAARELLSGLDACPYNVAPAQQADLRSALARLAPPTEDQEDSGAAE